MDSDGSLSKAEITWLYDRAVGVGQDLGPSAEAFFGQLDADGDGVVSQDEYPD